MGKTDKRSITSKINGKKGGVKTPDGKEISKHNSKKHGIFSKYPTELDDETFEEVYQEYAKEFGDDSFSRSMLIRELTVLHIRLKRCNRFESEFITARLNPPKYEKRLVEKGIDFDLPDLGDKYEEVLVDPGKPMTLHPGALEGLDNIYLKYEAQFLSRYCHIINMLSQSNK